MALPPHWLDDVIQKAIASNDPKKIAQSIADSPRFLGAIRDGLKDKPDSSIMGPSQAQTIREKVVKAVQTA